MPDNRRLYKKEKLCGQLAVEALFDRTNPEIGSALAYPLRMVWLPNPRRHNDADIRFAIVVPKRRLRHAVDRVTMRRRIREAYRLSRPVSPLAPARRGLRLCGRHAPALRPHRPRHAPPARTAPAN